MKAVGDVAATQEGMGEKQLVSLKLLGGNRIACCQGHVCMGSAHW